MPTAVVAGLGPPRATRLGAAYPNPFNSTVQVPLVLARAGEVRLTVHDVLGRTVAIVQRGALPAGRHEFSWDGLDERGEAAASGQYFLLLEESPGHARHSAVGWVGRVTLLR